MDIQINTMYLIDVKTLGSKQCRYEIEATGMLPDDPRSEKRRDVTRGTSEPARVRVCEPLRESTALDDLKSMLEN